jgi:molybdenum cofactor biosynthesis enzyme MoaA
MFLKNPYSLLKLNRLLKGHALKCIAVLIADVLKLRYLSIRVDPFLGCNLRCKMCHFSIQERRNQKKAYISVEDFERIASIFFKKSIQVVLGTGAEPTLHQSLPRLVEIAKIKYKVPFVGISTNGQLLNKGLILSLLKNGLDEIMISTHGVTKKTYEWLQPPASFDKLNEVLSLLTKISREENFNFKVRINYTVNPDNYSELAGFFDAFGNYKIDILQIRKIFDLGETEYSNRDLAPFNSALSLICNKLKNQCFNRNITLLSPSFEKHGRDQSSSFILLPLVLRFVSPTIVWKEDFNWRNESYETYCRRSGWRRSIIKMIFMNSKEVEKNIENVHRSLGYDVSN